jgi:glyoxylase-like metal-dependent hydrolase (beta-lactamase superfamily II)
MVVPEAVHVLPVTVETDGREVTVHPVAIDTERGPLLLDAGPPAAVDQLASGLERAGHALADVATVLVTHQDWDHAGGLAAMQEVADATVLAHELEAPAVDGRDDPRGAGDGDRYDPARVDVSFDGELTLATAAGPARVLHTPGHTPGHVSVYLPAERLLLAADALTADEDGLQGPNEAFTEEMGTALDSAGRLARLDIETTVCYHGGVVDAGSDRIAEIADRGRE